MLAERLPFSPLLDEHKAIGVLDVLVNAVKQAPRLAARASDVCSTQRHGLGELPISNDDASDNENHVCVSDP